MEHTAKSQKLLSGKNNSRRERFQMILRSGSEKSSGLRDPSTHFNFTSVEKSPVLHSVTQKSIKQHSQELSYHHHHYEHHRQHSDISNVKKKHEVHHHQPEQQNHIRNWINSHHKTQTNQFQTVSEDTAMSKIKHQQQAFSDYSSGNDEFDSDEDVKTDYTYASSGSYNSRVTPTRQCPSPNMSRIHLRRSNGSYYSHFSSDESVEVDEVALKAESRSHLRTSTPNVYSHEEKKNLSSLHTESEDQVCVITNHSSSTFLAQIMSPLFYCISIVCHSLYKFICAATSTDTFILSRCCSGRRNFCLLLLFLLPLLFLLQSLPVSSDYSRYFSVNYLTSLLPSQPNMIPLLDSSESTVDALNEVQRLKVKWQYEMEKTLNEKLELKWLEQAKQMEMRWNQQMQQMEQWQGIVLNRVKDMDIKAVYQEVLELKSILESRLRTENMEKSTAREELKLILERLNHLEEKQRSLEALLLDLENCCKKQLSLPVGISQAELDMQLYAFAQEVRANLSQLVLLQSTLASTSRHVDDINLTQRHNSSQIVPTLGDIEKIIKAALDRYDADKTGLVDYALESAGGSVVSTRCTESYPLGTAQFSLFGVPFWYSANTPRTVIQPQVHPGECWAMRGTQGYLVIQLSASVQPTAFSLEHIPRELSPTGKIDSAPKEFSVFGLNSEKDTEGQLLGQYIYIDDGEPLQKFNVQNPDKGIFSLVELRVHSNHGNADYTCLYRFRVHGIRQ